MKVRGFSLPFASGKDYIPFISSYHQLKTVRGPGPVLQLVHTREKFSHGELQQFGLKCVGEGGREKLT